ncbi:hypothetical protein MUO14_17745 [Halobacillus shinanisalinarum]|uniref:Uncharacterized protein n=1 Tax=Halobacillus shinanisalinarum TaxID=2932258 RepID=A0ABY4GWG6_9BACI|nr:hypothetical protein [Halobacillus shinanisalinarum]UOQ92301.1 hypothetical protein MUO14_17745 [Halobacillus shinanisalinarum]
MVDKRKNISKRDKRKDIARFIYILAVIVASPFLRDKFSIIGALVIALGAYFFLIYIVDLFTKDGGNS